MSNTPFCCRVLPYNHTLLAASRRVTCTQVLSYQVSLLYNVHLLVGNGFTKRPQRKHAAVVPLCINIVQCHSHMTCMSAKLFDSRCQTTFHAPLKKVVGSGLGTSLLSTVSQCKHPEAVSSMLDTLHQTVFSIPDMSVGEDPNSNYRI